MPVAKSNISKLLGNGGAFLNTEIHAALQELQGFRQVVVAGAAAATPMAVASLRDTDFIESAIVYTNAGGAPVEGKANITVASLKAQGKVTVAAVSDADTVTVDGTVFTFKDVPVGATDIRRVAGNNAENAARLAIAVNNHQNRRVNGSINNAVLVATAVGAVVTFTAVSEGTSGNAIGKITSNNTRLATVGVVLAGGAASGSFTSTDNLTGKTVVLTFYSKGNL